MNKKMSVYDDNEIERLVSEAEISIWYVSVLAKNDLTKYEQVRDSRYIDAVKTLEILINSF